MAKWSKEEIEKAIKMIENNKTYEEIGNYLGRTKRSVRGKLTRLGYKYTKFYNSENYKHEMKCKNCDTIFESYVSENRVFCSKSCSVSYNNKGVVRNHKKFCEIDYCHNCSNVTKNANKFCSYNCSSSYNSEIEMIYNNKSCKINYCLNCSNTIKGDKKYCTQLCHSQHKKNIMFEKIENGTYEYNNSKAYKDYLISKHGEKCMKCGWNERNPVTGNVPIELDHIDGDTSNNDLSNLRLLCPNHHSLTKTYKALNIGKGRSERKKYREYLKKLTLDELIKMKKDMN